MKKIENDIDYSFQISKYTIEIDDSSFEIFQSVGDGQIDITVTPSEDKENQLGKLYDLLNGKSK